MGTAPACGPGAGDKAARCMKIMREGVYHMHDYLAAIAASRQNGPDASGKNCPAITTPGGDRQRVDSPLSELGASRPFPPSCGSFHPGIYYIDRILIYLAIALFLLTVLAQLYMLS